MLSAKVGNLDGAAVEIRLAAMNCTSAVGTIQTIQHRPRPKGSMATDEAENEPSTLLEVRCVLNAMRRQAAGRLRVVGVSAYPEGRVKWNTGEALVCNFNFFIQRDALSSPVRGELLIIVRKWLLA